ATDNSSRSALRVPPAESVPASTQSPRSSRRDRTPATHPSSQSWAPPSRRPTSQSARRASTATTSPHPQAAPYERQSTRKSPATRKEARATSAEFQGPISPRALAPGLESANSYSLPTRVPSDQAKRSRP